MSSKMKNVFYVFLAVAMVLVMTTAGTSRVMAYSQTGPITVCNSAQLLDLGMEVIDEPFSTHILGGAQTWHQSTNWGDTHLKFTGSLYSPCTGTLVWSKTRAQLFTNPSSTPAHPWVISSYQHADGLLGFVHVELAGSNGNKGRIGLAWSTDNGDTYTYLGDILSPYGDPDMGGGFMQGVPYFIKDGYFYVYYIDNYTGSSGISVARAPVSSVITAAKAGNTGTNLWHKYYNGTWTESGLGGNAAKLNINGITHSNAAYSTYTGKYYIALTTMTWSGIDTWIKLYESTDGINWTLTQTVAQDTWANLGEAMGYQNVSIVNTDGSNNGTIGKQFYIYGGFNSYSSPKLYRWTIDLSSTSHQASRGFSSTQGANHWSYQYWNGSAYTNMTWDSANGWWSKSGTYSLVHGSGQHPDTGADAVRKFTAPSAGNIKITGTVKKYDTAGGDGVRVKIMKNGTQIWPASGWQSIAYNDATGYNVNISTSVAANDAIYFITNMNGTNSNDSTIWDPIVTYGASYQASVDFSKTQGMDNWSYQYWNGSAYTNMTWDSANGWWSKSGTYSIVHGNGQHPDIGADSVRKFTAPSAGTIKITGTVRKGDITGGDGVRVKILKNGTQIWPASGWQSIAYNNATGYSVNVTTSVAANDAIYFIVNNNSTILYDLTMWDPIITYQ